MKGSHGNDLLQVQAHAMCVPGVKASPQRPALAIYSACRWSGRTGRRSAGCRSWTLRAPPARSPPRPPSLPNNGSSVPTGIICRQRNQILSLPKGKLVARPSPPPPCPVPVPLSGGRGSRSSLAPQPRTSAPTCRRLTSPPPPLAR